MLDGPGSRKILAQKRLAIRRCGGKYTLIPFWGSPDEQKKAVPEEQPG
jgi:hypothetical protein